jgi:hypothetical protein
MLRHESPQQSSKFAAVLEPYAQSPFLKGIERLALPQAALALRIRTAERTDIVILGAEKPVEIAAGEHKITFQGEAGILSLRDAEVEHTYALGGSGWTVGTRRYAGSLLQRRALQGIEKDALVVQGGKAKLPRPGDVVTVVTEDGWRYPFTMVEALPGDPGARLKVVEGPGMTYDAASHRLRLSAYPQREHQGKVQVEWYAR